MVSCGDVVLLDFPFSGGGNSKVRPALVVSSDRDNRRLTNVIVAMITTRTHRASAEPTQVLIDVSTPDGAKTGLLITSAVNYVNLFTVDHRRLVKVIGALSPALLTQVRDALRTALDVA